MEGIRQQVLDNWKNQGEEDGLQANHPTVLVTGFLSRIDKSEEAADGFGFRRGEDFDLKQTRIGDKRQVFLRNYAVFISYTKKKGCITSKCVIRTKLITHDDKRIWGVIL